MYCNIYLFIYVSLYVFIYVSCIFIYEYLVYIYVSCLKNKNHISFSLINLV